MSELAVDKTWLQKKKYRATVRYLRFLRTISGKVETHRTKVWKAHVHSNMTFGADVTDTGFDPKKAGL